MNRKRAPQPRIPTQVESAILRLTEEEPLLGQDRIARELRSRRLWVSPSGVRYVWQRHNLETLEKRARHLEAKVKKTGVQLTANQIIACERAALSRKSRQRKKMYGDELGGRHTNGHILAAAARLFRTNGFDATSLRDIARTASIPVGSLYYHFPSKDELFATVYEEAMERITTNVLAAVEQTGGGAWDRLRAACTAHLQMLCEPDDFAIAPLAAQINGLEQPIRTRLNSLNKRYEEIYRRLIAELQLPASIDQTLLRLQLLGAIIWTPVWYRPGKAKPSDVANHLIEVFRRPLDDSLLSGRRHSLMEVMPGSPIECQPALLTSGRRDSPPSRAKPRKRKNGR